MDRGAWQATVHGVARVRHDLVTKPPPPTVNLECALKFGFLIMTVIHLSALHWEHKCEKLLFLCYLNYKYSLEPNV